MPTTVLVVSASMGAGHDGAARELVRRLDRDGHRAVMQDFVTSAPLRIGRAVRRGYELELRHAAWAYDMTYRFWYLAPFLGPSLGRFVARLTRRRVLRWIEDLGADVVVSTYPLATLALGHLRASGQLQIPAVNFITDFGVHPLWVHRSVDVNLAIHPRPAAEAAARSGRPAIAAGPMVSPAFGAGEDREAARALLGLGAGDRAVLIVAGSWGVGGVEATVTDVAGGRFVPVVVCGHDERLQQRLTDLLRRRAWPGVVLGWTDRMPALMAACDALVENAGGLTSLEAMRAGLPVISYKPIAGHGRENTAAMQAAGVSRLAADGRDLLDALTLVTVPGPARRSQIDTGRALFARDPAQVVLDVARGSLAQSDPATTPGRT